MAKQKTVRNRILETIKERMKDVASPEGNLRFDTGPVTSFQMLSLSGTYTPDPDDEYTYRRYLIETISPSEINITRTYEEKSSDSPVTHNVSVGSNVFALSDSGISLEFTSTDGVLVVGQSFNVRMNQADYSSNSVTRYIQTEDSTHYPCITVLPETENKATKISDRYNNKLHFIIEYKLNMEASELMDMEEWLGDIQDELTRSHRLRETNPDLCLNIELWVDKVEDYASDGISDWVGGYIKGQVHYRHAERNTRVPRN